MPLIADVRHSGGDKVSEAKYIIKSAFSGSLDHLSEQYEILTSMSPDDRDLYVSNVNKSYDETEILIKSEKTKASLDLILKFQYLSRFKYKIHGGDDWYGRNSKAKNYMVENFTHVCRMGNVNDDVLGIFKRFVYETPKLDYFMEVSYQGLNQVDFYTKVKFVLNDLYGISCPTSAKEDLSEWIKSENLAEEDWDWEYKNKVQEWNKRWFKSKSSLYEIQNEWNERKRNIVQYIQEVSSLYSHLYDSNEWLSSLMKRELLCDVDLHSINKAYGAIRDGVKLEHLLLEESHKLADAWGKVGRGL